MFESIYNICCPFITNIMYYLIYIYTWIVSFGNKENKRYMITSIHLHSDYKHNVLYYKNMKSIPSFRFIKIKYTYNNKSYNMIINSSSISDIDVYYPPYNLDVLDKINTNINPIIAASLVIKDQTNDIDVTELVNEYAGPAQDFYKSIDQLIFPKINDIWGPDIIKLNIITNEVEEITFKNSDVLVIA